MVTNRRFAPGRRARQLAALLLTVLGASAAFATVSPTPAIVDGAGATIAPALPRPAMPLEAFFANPEFSQPQLSPSGRLLAVLHEADDQPGRNLRIIDLQTNDARTVTTYDTYEVAWFTWIDEQRIAYRAAPPDNPNRAASVFGNEWFNVVDISRQPARTVRFSSGQHSKSPRRQATIQAQWHSIRLLDPRPIDGDKLLVTVRNERLNPPVNSDGKLPPAAHFYTDVATVNVRTGDIRRLARNSGQVYHWLVDRKGKARIAMRLDDDLGVHVMHRPSGGKHWQEIYSFEYGGTGIWPLAFTRDPDLVYVLSNAGRDTRALYTFDLKTGKLRDELFAHDTVDVSGIVLSRDGERAIGARYETDRSRIHYFDAYRQAIDTELADALSQYQIEVQFSDDSAIALVTAHNEKNEGRFYHFNADSGELRELFHMRGFLPEENLSNTQAIGLRARDGEQLHGFLTMPRGASGPEPMVVLVHGGPHDTRDKWGFDPEVQFLANRGYAVLQINFRGSGGYGRRFEQLGWGHWGAAIQNDIADAVRWAVDSGHGAADRICIYGWSFGGYSALMNMALNPGLYRCGVSFGGVTDLPALVAGHSPVDLGRQSFLEKVLGQDKDEAELAQISPVNRVLDLDAPVLVAHGLRDDVVPVSHFEKLVRALARHGKDGEGLLLENEGHGLSGEAARYLFYRTLEAFLERHLATGPAPAADPI
ncbi:MAG: S9 family peptidase [Gammaproteobacteria bacterium]|nr:S9 family peptidase [Gammaproteobacteria bacterium]